MPSTRTNGLLAACAVLALGCDYSNVTRPPALPDPMAEVTPLPVSSVVASGYQAPNVPQNTRDNDISTRWSQEGDGQWIQYDLGAATAINRVDIAWYQTSTGWESAFDIEVSPDAVTWTRVFSGRSMAGNVQPQGYGFPPVTGRYVRIVGHGQWNGATLLSRWNSITEVNLSNVSSTTISVAASGFQDGNVPGNTLDHNLATRWSVEGDGQWIGYDLRALMPIGRVDIAWWQRDGQQWESAFDIEVSPDAVTWRRVFSGRSVAGNVQPQGYGFPTVTGRYVRIVGHGQWNGATLLSRWNSITEVGIDNVLDATAVGASGYQDPNLPRNTMDNALGTRWSANGDGQWISYDLGAPTPIGALDIAWYQPQGQQWESVFDIEVSRDAATWTKIRGGRSTAGNVQYQSYPFSGVTCRYIRIVGHGQWNGATLSSFWNSITEVDIRPGSAAGTCPTSTPTTARSTGLGTLGLGSPSPGSDRQDFDFDVAADLTGRLFYRDFTELNTNGTVEFITVDPKDSQTHITAYRDRSDKCTDPTHGAEFDGTGRLDDGTLTSFTVSICDNGVSGSGADFFQFVIPGDYSHGGFLTSGDITKSGTATP
jgi:hypothetical protein